MKSSKISVLSVVHPSLLIIIKSKKLRNRGFYNFLWIDLTHSKIRSKIPDLFVKTTLCKVAKKMLDNVASDPRFLKHIFTGNETWFYEYDIEDTFEFSE